MVPLDIVSSPCDPVIPLSSDVRGPLVSLVVDTLDALQGRWQRSSPWSVVSDLRSLTASVAVLGGSFILPSIVEGIHGPMVSLGHLWLSDLVSSFFGLCPLAGSISGQRPLWEGVFAWHRCVLFRQRDGGLAFGVSLWALQSL